MGGGAEPKSRPSRLAFHHRQCPHETETFVSKDSCLTEYYFAGYDKSKVSPIGAPDNIVFDLAGNAWVATDGAASAIKLNDGLFAIPVAGSERGHVQQFFSSVAGSEVCGPEFTPDNRTLFLAIQHPGEGGTFEKPISTWPDRQGLPRPSVITIQAFDNRRIGQ